MITFLLFILVLASSKEKASEIEMVTKEYETPSIDNFETAGLKETIDSLNNQTSLTLPTPDAKILLT